jgi:putative flippase GtrA
MSGSTGSSAQDGGVEGRLARIFREVAKFGAVGGAGILVNLGVFNLLRHGTQLQVVRASVAATVVAIVFNYLGFRYFTYRDRDRNGRPRELGLFVLFSIVGLVIENGVLYMATYGFGWDSQLQSNVFKFLGIGVATLFRFWSYRTWVFRALPVSREALEQAESFLAEAETDGARRRAAVK